MAVVRVIVILLRTVFLPRAALAAEILALRHQLGALQRSVMRPPLRQRDRIFTVCLSGEGPATGSSVCDPGELGSWRGPGVGGKTPGPLRRGGPL